MKLSRYFSDLRSAYEAELDDLTSDSEGKDVLKKRLAAKRSEIGFLVQMLSYSPEMVAVVFHRGFRFAKPAALGRAGGAQGAGRTRRSGLHDGGRLPGISARARFCLGRCSTEGRR